MLLTESQCAHGAWRTRRFGNIQGALPSSQMELDRECLLSYQICWVLSSWMLYLLELLPTRIVPLKTLEQF